MGPHPMSKSYDVVLLGFRTDAAERPESALARIVGITPEEGEALLRNVPRTVVSDVSYATAETFAASLGLAGAEVTVVDHPFDAPDQASHGQSSQAVPLSLRSTRPAPEPAVTSTALALPGGHPSLPYRPTDVDARAGEHTAPAREPAPAPDDDGVEDEARVERMGVLSIPPPRPQRFRYAAVAMLVGAAYCVWLYLLERM